MNNDMFTLTPGASIRIHIGLGGWESGGTTSFGTYLSANGGTAGNDTSGEGCSGGTAGCGISKDGTGYQFGGGGVLNNIFGIGGDGGVWGGGGGGGACGNGGNGGTYGGGGEYLCPGHGFNINNGNMHIRGGGGGIAIYHIANNLKILITLYF